MWVQKVSCFKVLARSFKSWLVYLFWNLKGKGRMSWLLSTRPFYKNTRSASFIDANLVHLVQWDIAQGPQFQESCRVYLCRGIPEIPQEYCSWILGLLSRASPATDQVESPVFVVTEDVNILFSSSVNNLQNWNSQHTLRWETPSAVESQKGIQNPAN